MNYEKYKDRGLCGLKNIGNTCFMNSAIQCMSNTLVLTDYFILDKYTDDCNFSKKEYNLVREWKRLLEGLWNNNKCIITPTSFHKVVSLLSQELYGIARFGNFSQHDVQEFLTFMINTLHNALCSEVIVKITGEVKNDLDKLALEAMKRWRDFFKNEYSIIIEIFYSQIFSVTKCIECGNVSYVFDPICCHTLSIPNIINKKITLYDCYEMFTRQEYLDGEDMWKCDKCNDVKCANKRLLLWSTPKVLIICLKRFKNFVKNNVLIDFPLILDLKEYCIGYEKNRSRYNLYGICNHSGNLTSGHYYAYCKNKNSKWYKFNDNSISEIPENKLVTSNAYCLFYEKIIN
tara:strand:+ start:803 stop:1840 length:1038 start_codon:yes stop_codon:yes gene_type:complete